MALIDESEEAFRESLDVFPSTIVFNGIRKPCVCEPLHAGKAQDLVGYSPDIAQGVTMLQSDFNAFGNASDFEGTFTINDDPTELTFIEPAVTHPNSAVVRFVLVSQK
jgi:hypothetical protein